MRILKGLGASALAVLALSACLATSASADTFTSESTPVTLTGAQTNINEFFLPGIGVTRCNVVTSHASVGTPGTTVSGVAPVYSECETAGLVSLVAMNGCTYTFHLGAATTGTTDIVCPAGAKIKITMLQGETSKCTMEIGPQNGLATVTYTNTGAGTTRDLLLHLELVKLSYTATAGTGLGACGGGGSNNAAYDGTITWTGEKPNGTQHVGVFMS